ncbi:hypothetical protein PGT21_012103 [Puccinia graminis f. sp. tritici]|uniref:Uncharacterized protein n=1 Tax=Puccinia graminis f. sp. tritici TaxID=56615 RepID=A0A5B0NJ67_PUCGR|nr:hypothetical protein PGT21_012103 [Puccinia graminis f. sp. tritici]
MSLDYHLITMLHLRQLQDLNLRGKSQLITNLNRFESIALTTRPNYRCAGYTGRSDPQYCTENAWAYKFEPTAAILEDVPNGLRSRATNLFNDQYNTDNYFGVWSRIGFYFLFIAACLVALILLFSLIQARGPGRLGSLNLSVISLLAFISNTIGTVIWTAIAGILKHQLSRDTIGMSASYGNAIWLLWAIDGLLLFASFGYLGGCIRGRRSQVV